jgi:1-deoxy-D-xylulose-5-phosphate reductoisomerase
METRGLSGAAFNAAKEIALDHFIAGELPFLAMAQVVEDTLARLSRQNSLQIAATALEDVLQMDHLARKTATDAVKTWQQGR